MERHLTGIIKLEDTMIFLPDYEKIIYDIESASGVETYHVHQEGFDERRAGKN